MSMNPEEIPALDLMKPYGMNQEQDKITTFDQGGYLYDGLTHMHLTNLDKTKYAIPEGAPFSKVKTTQEKISEAVATIRASGAVDPDTLSKFDRMFRNMLAEEPSTKGSESGGSSSSSGTSPKYKRTE